MDRAGIDRAMRVMQAALKLIISTLVGSPVGGVSATACFTVVNLRAGDGPCFPPALVAPVVVIPIALESSRERKRDPAGAPTGPGIPVDAGAGSVDNR